MPAAPPNERGKKGGRGKKAPVLGKGAFGNKATARYRKIAKNKQKIEEYCERSREGGRGKKAPVADTGAFSEHTTARYRKVAKNKEKIEEASTRAKSADYPKIRAFIVCLACWRGLVGPACPDAIENTPPLDAAVDVEAHRTGLPWRSDHAPAR